jgi:hypothetical protein
MRILLAVVVFTSLAACGKKQAPKNPGSAEPTESSEKSDGKNESTGATDANKPDQADDAPKDMKSDPCDGGE